MSPPHIWTVALSTLSDKARPSLAVTGIGANGLAESVSPLMVITTSPFSGAGAGPFSVTGSVVGWLITGVNRGVGVSVGVGVPGVGERVAVGGIKGVPSAWSRGRFAGIIVQRDQIAEEPPNDFLVADQQPVTSLGDAKDIDRRIIFDAGNRDRILAGATAHPRRLLGGRSHRSQEALHRVESSGSAKASRSVSSSPSASRSVRAVAYW